MISGRGNRILIFTMNKKCCLIFSLVHNMICLNPRFSAAEYGLLKAQAANILSKLY